MFDKTATSGAPLPRNWKFVVEGRGDPEHALATCKDTLTTLFDNEHSLSGAEFEVVGLTAAESVRIPLPVLLGGLGAKPDRKGQFDGEESNGWVWSQPHQQWEDPNDAGVDEVDHGQGRDRGRDRSGADRGGRDRSGVDRADLGVDRNTGLGVDRNTDLGVDRGVRGDNRELVDRDSRFPNETDEQRATRTARGGATS